MERDVDWLDLGANILNFNSHAHVERDEQMTPAINALSDFNSHAHVERDGITINLDSPEQSISTHTLTWSVTRFQTILKY